MCAVYQEERSNTAHLSGTETNPNFSDSHTQREAAARRRLRACRRGVAWPGGRTRVPCGQGPQRCPTTVPVLDAAFTVHAADVGRVHTHDSAADFGASALARAALRQPEEGLEISE